MHYLPQPLLVASEKKLTLLVKLDTKRMAVFQTSTFVD
jgi:hypothetical protein